MNTRKPKKPTRAEVLGWIAFAGYHQDSGEFVRYYVEYRVSYAAAKAAYRAGARQKAAGIGCGCNDCKREAEQRKAERDTLLGPEVQS